MNKKDSKTLSVSRYLSETIQQDLTEKMVFLGGPRQVGKTILSLSLLKAQQIEHPAYFNWDNIHTHQPLLKGQLPLDQPLIVLDEIHKYSRWRNLVKGFYDQYRDRCAFLITGSARLDYYRKGGDSLQGRYHYHRLHPLSLNEINRSPTHTDTQHLLTFGGFPEPCLRGDQTHWRRWQKERLARVIYEDIQDLERINEISLIEVLLDALPDRVGSPLSVKNLRETLEVAHPTAERWLTILERLYVCFRILPYGSPKIRAVKKEQKLYFWDWSQVPTGGARFENLVASQLLKYCHFIEDTQGYHMELRFLRDTDKREVDFVILKDKQPIFAVECKMGEKQINPAIGYFQQRTPIPKFYQIHLGTAAYQRDNVQVMPFHQFCRVLDLP